MSKLYSAIINELITNQPSNSTEVARIKKNICRQFTVTPPRNSDLLKHYQKMVTKGEIKKNEALEKVLRIRDVRTLSGVAIITVLTKPFPCPGKCVYCPTEDIMPKSYLSNEPAAMRALRNIFDPYRQVLTRIAALERNGHPTDKIELIVKGGTWSAYPRAYQAWFIRRCFEAMNDGDWKDAEAKFLKPFIDNKEQLAKDQPWNEEEELDEQTENKILLKEQLRNETANHRCIGLTLETRPDWVSLEEIHQLRRLGTTRIEMGVQTLDDQILADIKRGHTTAQAIAATKLLKDAGFKTDYHMMPQLPGATPESDLAMHNQLWSDPNFRPDMIKIYPCVVVANAELYSWWKAGKYKPYSDQELIDTIIAIKTNVPRYVRLSRIIRDIPSTSIVDGNMVTNLRQTIQQKIKEQNLVCNCLRCREVGHALRSSKGAKWGHRESLPEDATPHLFVDEYEVSEGKEYFLSFEDKDRTTVFAFCRLRLPKKNNDVAKVLPELQDAGLIRELHTYGHLVAIGKSGDGDTVAQHKGLGRKLMAKAEEITKEGGYPKMAVISGIGVREYYRLLGYETEGTYMTKKL